jgi:hypothetical protein
MLQEKKTNANIGVGLGLIILIAFNILGREGYLSVPGGNVLGAAIEVVGILAFCWGCMNYADGKGHSKWLGLLGLLCCIGLVVLVLLPDRNKEIK